MSGPREVLDQLDHLRAVDPCPVLPWHVDPQDPHRIATRLEGGVCSTYLPGDADLIVAAVNALPQLTAALRAVLDLASHWDNADDLAGSDGPNRGQGLTQAITAALSPADPMSVEPGMSQP